MTKYFDFQPLGEIVTAVTSMLGKV